MLRKTESALLDIDTCAAEARTLHPETRGWFATLRKRPGATAIEKLHQMSSLDAVVSALDRAPDVYLSQASFVRAKRLVSTFQSVNCAFVDIDCYSDKPGSPQVPADDQFVRMLLAEAKVLGFPEPSYVTFSGQGIYCKWIFERPIDAHQLPRWQELQHVLVRAFRKLGADVGARDAARYLRVMGSSHREAKAQVRVAVNNHSIHSFAALCHAAAAVDPAHLCAPLTSSTAVGTPGATKRRAKIKPANASLLLDSRGSSRVLHDYATAREPILLKLGTRDHLNWSRFIDMRTLAQLRGGIQQGSRDLMMFWMADFLGHAGVVTSSNLESEVRGLLGAFDGGDFDPIADGSLLTLAQRLRQREAGERVHFNGGSYDALYTPTNDHLIDVLSITRDEQEQLATIIDGQEKLRRADLKVPGRADRRQARFEWRTTAREMAAEALVKGESHCISKISAAVGIDRRQVARLLKGELERDPNRIETRGRKKHAVLAGVSPHVRTITNGGFSSRVVVTPRGARASAPGSPDILATQAIRKAMQSGSATAPQILTNTAATAATEVDLADADRSAIATLRLRASAPFSGLRAPKKSAAEIARAERAERAQSRARWQASQPRQGAPLSAPSTDQATDKNAALPIFSGAGTDASVHQGGVVFSISRKRREERDQALGRKDLGDLGRLAPGGSILDSRGNQNETENGNVRVACTPRAQRFAESGRFDWNAQLRGPAGAVGSASNTYGNTTGRARQTAITSAIHWRLEAASGRQAFAWKQHLRPPRPNPRIIATAANRREVFDHLLKTLPEPSDREIILATQFAAYVDDPQALKVAADQYMKERASGRVPFDLEARQAADKEMARARAATDKSLDALRQRHGLPCSVPTFQPPVDLGPDVAAVAANPIYAKVVLHDGHALSSKSGHTSVQDASPAADEELSCRCEWTHDMFDLPAPLPGQQSSTDCVSLLT